MSVVGALNDGWGWTGIKAAKVHDQSPMGHLIFASSEGCFYYLDVDGMRIETLGTADAVQAHFATREAQELWSGGALVDAARNRFGELPEGHVFNLEPLALLQGQYEADQMCVLPLEDLIRFTGDAARQLKDLSDGAQFQVKVVD